MTLLQRQPGEVCWLPNDHAEVQDILEVMRQKELKTYRRNFQVTELEALWRKILIEWMVYVVDHCKLQRHTVEAAAYYLDIAMHKGLLCTREEHQLAAASCLQLALKLFDSTVIRIEKLVSLGRGLFTEEDVVCMEYQLLLAMNFQCHPPSSHCFLKQYERLLPRTLGDFSRHFIDEVAALIANLVVVDHNFMCVKTSEIAYAAMLMAMEMLSYEDFSIPQRQCFILQMSSMAKLDSSSPQILYICKKLQATLDDSSSQLDDVLKSMLKCDGKKTDFEEPRLKRPSLFTAKLIQSPRDVMGRVGSMRDMMLTSQ